jgi:hypothetical protein
MYPLPFSEQFSTFAKVHLGANSPDTNVLRSSNDLPPS